MVSETKDGFPIFGWCFVDGVYTVNEGRRVKSRSGRRCRDSRVVEHPEETRKVIHGHAIEDTGICI